MNIRQSLKHWGDYRRTVRELNALDNRTLNDLGISRDEIQSLAKRRVVEAL